jgi:hypothetical protein
MNCFPCYYEGKSGALCSHNAMMGLSANGIPSCENEKERRCMKSIEREEMIQEKKKGGERNTHPFSGTLDRRHRK